MALRNRRLTAAILAVAGWGASRSEAQLPLVTIHDAVYKADGTAFEGYAYVQWKTFVAGNGSTVGTQNVTARIIKGSLFVKLSPTTTSATGGYYEVRYVSSGRFQFSEIWAVPPSAAPLRLSQVRARLLPGGVVVGNNTGVVPPGENTGLIPGFVDGETPQGILDGANAAFSLAQAPTPPESLSLFRNGLLQTSGIDYVLVGQTISFYASAIPTSGDSLEAFYRTAGTAAGSQPHELLSATHSDATAASVQRGDLIAGQGVSPVTFSRVALGLAGRCLVSNGLDVLWGECKYTGFANGAVPFTDSSGSLAQNSNALVWDNATRRLSVGNNLSRGTLLVHDSGTAGVTQGLVRAGSGQGSVPVMTWQDVAGNSMAWVNADGGFNVRRLLTNSTAIRAAISDTGTTADPSGRGDGDIWFNTAAGSRKTQEAGQVHTLPQVICAATGSGTNATTSTDLGTCRIPAALLKEGDRLWIRAHYSHEGTQTPFTADIRFGGVSLLTRTTVASEQSFAVNIEAGLQASTVYWGAQSFGSATVHAAQTGTGTFSAGTALVIAFQGAMGSATAETATLRSFSVIRIPAQANP